MTHRSTPVPRWHLLAFQLVDVWCRALECELALSEAESRPLEWERALAAIMEAAMPKWPLADRVSFAQGHLASFRRLSKDPAVSTAIQKRSYGSANLEIVNRTLFQICDSSERGGIHEAEAVIAGVIDRLYGPEARLAYIMNNVLDPTPDADDEDEDEENDEDGDIDASPETALPLQSMTPFESRVSGLLRGAGTILLVIFGTGVLFSGSGVVSDVARYGLSDFWLMTHVPDISVSSSWHSFTFSFGWVCAGLLLLRLDKYLRGPTRD